MATVVPYSANNQHVRLFEPGDTARTGPHKTFTLNAGDIPGFEMVLEVRTFIGSPAGEVTGVLTITAT